MDKLKKYFYLWMPILSGIAAFTLITGGEIVWPTNIDWLFLHGDNTSSFDAWQFFRHTPILQNPLGAIYPYGMGMGGSIIYSEPLFLFAFPFKLISSFLPTTFQYSGLWIFSCFILQAIFSWKLLEKITNDRWLKLFGSLFFVLAPAFLWRLHGSSSFLGQWLILAGIWLYLSSSFRRYAWLSVLIITSLVHAYFLFMLLAIWGSDLIKRIILNELKYLEIIKYAFLTILVLILVMWQAGYFSIHSGFEGAGLGYFRMNLLSFFDPSDVVYNSWSRFLSKQPNTPGDYEGFSYLGFGMLILGILGLAKFLALDKKKYLIVLKRIFPLLTVSVLLMIFALSNRIALGQHEILSYRLPDFFCVFRASGRMILPMYYLIYLGVFYITIESYKKLNIKLLILICLCLQIVDSSNIYKHFKDYFTPKNNYISPLKSNIWTEAEKKYKNLVYIFPEYFWKLLPLIDYAALNKLNTNIGYFARIDFKKAYKIKVKLMDNIINGKLDQDTMYVIKEKLLRKIIVNSQINFPYKVVEADGFFLLLPNWKDKSTDEEKLSWSRSNLYKLGTNISLETSESNFKDYLILFNGWNIPEGKGTWSEGDNSTFFLIFEKLPESNLILTIHAIPFVTEKHPNLAVDVLVNNHFVGKLQYKLNNFSYENKIEIPKTLINTNDLLKVQFIYKKPISPAMLKINGDSRMLGLFISSFRLDSKTIL
ncbi:DUF6311 domain-containing protein [Rickettsiella endosymbiont of Xylota segnis]|uniref:DUF6311 domain-containing protein n=1 Tax=Rickettsiella endosymbiont of Xylota segnis TaxID=3066238 RepID=UPI0030D10E5E